MKRYRKFLTVILSVMILLYYVLLNGVKVQAAYGDDMFHWHTDTPFSYYEMNDSSSIPSGRHFFYKYADNKCWYTTYANVLALLMNKKFGLSVNTGILASLVSDFDTFYDNFEQENQQANLPKLVYKNGSRAGYALNDISSCAIVNPSGSSNDVTVPSDTTNFVFIYVKNYLDTNYSSPDYITYVGYTPTEAKGLLDSGRSYYQNKFNDIENNSNNFILALSYAPSANIYDLDLRQTTSFGAWNIGTGKIFYANNGYDTVCSAFALTSTHNSISAADVVTYNGSLNSLICIVNDSVQGTNELERTQYDSTYLTPSTSTVSTNAVSFTPFRIDRTIKYVGCYKDPVTIYKNSTIATQVKNHTYAPTYNTTTTYNNYDSTSNSNETNFNTNNVDNSSNNNSTIYNEQSENYYDNSYYNSENNYYIDNSQVTENNTTIINNYYGDEGGGGGGSDDDDDDDDPIWKALLKAIADFFKKLGELIATVLTGIVTILTSILDAIATIVTDFTGITDFLGQIFSWLPSEIITLMTLGLTTALFAAFLTWFKK